MQQACGKISLTYSNKNVQKRRVKKQDAIPTKYQP